MENRSHALMTGFFTIALLVATVLAGIWFNRDRVERVPYEIATTLSVPGLNPQAAVRYRGLEVGKVNDIAFDTKVPGQILIRLALDPETPITKTTFATLGYQGVTGIAYVQLDDDSLGSKLLPSDKDHLARIPLLPGFMDQLEKRGKAILAQTEELTARANVLLSPANQKAMVKAFEDVSQAATAYSAIPQRLEPALARIPELTDKFDRSLTSFSEFNVNATRLSKNWDKLATDLQGPNGTVAKLNGIIDRVGGNVEGITSDIELQTLPHLVAMTDEAKTSMRAVKRTMNNLNDRPQSLLFGAPSTVPGPGEPGFTPPAK